MDTTEAYLALNLLPKVGPVRVRRLLEQFGSPERVLSAPVRELVRVPGIGSEMAGQIASWEERIDLPEEKRRISDHGISLLTLEDEGYPPSLRQIHDPPFLLYAKGRLLPRDRRAVGVVGSRRATHYGKEQARKLGFQLARAGFTIVSGLARGIDTAAHQAALAAEGRTLAVLGSGIGHLYPPENQALADEIAEGGGAVISEFPVLYVPDKQSFPLRNRIVSGLSEALLVVEAPRRSGALITANQALEQGRSVFAVPGPVNRPSSEGCNRLIRQGATLVCDAADIVEDLDTAYSSLPLWSEEAGENGPPPREPPSGADDSTERSPPRGGKLSPLQARILDELEGGELTVDQLCERTGRPSSEVSVSLLQLEMRHRVKQLPGKYFTKLI